MSHVRNSPALDAIPGTAFQLRGWVGDYLAAVSDHWLKTVPASNPAILEMFRDREKKPPRDLLNWSGEFAGKYLTGAVQVYRLTGDAELRAVLAKFVAELVTLQTPSGYLGPWPAATGLNGRAVSPEGKDYDTWDAWGHYFAMMGLMLWFDVSGDLEAFDCARKIGDLLCATFEHQSLVETRSTEMNLAPIHSLAQLHARTGEKRYLRLAEKFRGEFAARDGEGKPMAGDYFEGPLAGKEFFELPKPRWESLHPIMGLAELYWNTGDERSRAAFEKIWWSIAQWDRHNNGGFSSGEQAQGNPYDPRPIETCCTIAWSAMSVEMLRLTGDSIVADELELALLNSITGLHSPSGRWATYNTPMDGVRKASTQDISFQAREGSPELNCCSVNSARGFGLLSEWAVMRSAEGITLNWYGPGTMVVPLADGHSLRLEQATDYPAGSRVRLTVRPGQPARFPLRLRIPHWSRTTKVRVNGAAMNDVACGRYLRMERDWTEGDTVELEFDFGLQLWTGERECAGKASVYRGPLLLACDRRFNAFELAGAPALVAAKLRGKDVTWTGSLPPLVLVEFTGGDGRTIRLCDFASAGQAGSPYRSWLDLTGAPMTPFSRGNPRRSAPIC